MPYTDITSGWNKDLNVKDKALQFLEENSFQLRVTKTILNKTQKSLH